MPKLLMNIYLIAAAAATLVILFGMYRALMSPALKYHSFIYKLKAKFVFWCGRVKRLPSFPFVTWARVLPKVDYSDARKCSDIARPGDIGLHTEEGCLSNFGIPGAFKHAWIWTGNKQIVEACQEGVMERDEFHPVVCDYTIMLRPKGVTQAEIDKAVARAKQIVGCEYDANFNFDLEKADEELGRYTRNLSAGEFHPAFSCTETVAFAWYHKHKDLGIFRSVHAGREAIIADDYLRMHFDVVWMSPSVTLEWATKKGMHEEGRQKIKDYCEGKHSV